MNEPERVLAWQQLRDWTVWLVNRYRLTLEDRLPGCWPQHPELIEELWALRAWRAEAYSREGNGQSAVYWHQALVGFLGHVSSWWAGGCRAGHASTDTDLDSEQTAAWAHINPLGGIPHRSRTAASADPEKSAIPDLNVLSAEQMQALTNAGLARPHPDAASAFTHYDGSWWACDSTDDHDPTWYRANEDDLGSSLLLTTLPDQ